MRPLEATYLAWLDASAYGHEDPAAVALERGRVMVSRGSLVRAGLHRARTAQHRHLPDRLTEIVERLAKAWALGRASPVR